MSLKSGREPRVPATAVALTAVSLVLLNVAFAYLLSRAASLRVMDLPDAVLLAIAALGMLAGILAVVRWRAFVAEARVKAAARGDGDVRMLR